MNDPKINEDLISQKIAILRAASAAKTEQLDINYRNALALRAAGANIPEQADALRTAGDVAIKVGQGVVGVGQAAVGLGSLATGGLVGDGMKAIGYRPEELKATMGEYLSDSQKAADAKVQQAQGFVNTLKASLQNPRSILGSVAESAPGMLAGMGVTGAVARGIASRAALSATAGMTGDAAAIKLVADKASQAAIESASTRLLAVGAATEGAQTTGNIVEQAQSAGREYSDYALPAIAAGVGTGAISLISGKLLGDAATDIATGTKTLKGSYAAKLAKEAFSEGVAEELPQSAQEQVFTNMAMGEQDLSKGVGNAAASGLLAGAAMGVGMGSFHRSDNSKVAAVVKAKDTAAKRETLNAAVDSNDISAFTDPKSPNYDLSSGMKVLMAHAMKPDTTPEVKAANLKQAGELMTKLEEQHAKVKEEADGWSADTVNQYKASLAGVEANLKAANPSNAAQIAALTEQRDTLAEHIDYLTDSKNKSKKTAADTAFSKLDRQLKDSKSYMEGLVNTNNPYVAPEAVTTLVNQANTTTPEASTAASSLINLSMIQPDSMTNEQALELANNTSNSLTTAQRDHLRAFSAARIAQNNVSTTSDVSQTIMNGDANNMGLAQYRARVATALVSDNEVAATKSLDQLRSFATSHTQKVRLALKALAAVPVTGAQQLIKTETNGWELKPAGYLSDKKLKENGGLTIHGKSGPLIADIQKEAAAINAAGVEMKSAIAMKFGVQSNSSAKQAVPPGNINTPTNEEDTARPTVPVEPSTAKAPKNSTTATKGQNHEEAASTPSNEADGQRQGQKQGQGQETLLTPEAPAKTATTEQPAAVSEANPAPVAEVVPADAVSTETPPTTEDTSATPSSTPASLAVADAPATTEVSSAEPAVAALLNVAGPDVPFREKLLGDFFVQTGAGTNPLASVKDFLTTIKSMANLHDWVPSVNGKFSNAQIVALQSFKKVADKWIPLVKENLAKKKDQSYAYQDMMNYFIMEDSDGNIDIDHNVKTAIVYAATSYVIENAGGSAYNTDAQMAKLLGAGKDYVATSEERALLGSVIGHQSMVVNQLGQRVLTALGLKLKPGAPLNIPSQMAGALGAHVLRLLVDGKNPIIKRKFIPVAELKQVLHKNRVGLEEEDATDKVDDDTAVPRFNSNTPEKYENYLEFNRNAEKKLTAAAEFIIEHNRDSNGVVNSLFSVEEPTVPPTFTPMKKVAKLIKRSKQVVPNYLVRVMQDLNSQENFLRQDKFNVRTAVGDDAFLAMMGWQDADPAYTHAANIESRLAANAALERELSNMDEFVNSYLKPQEKGFDQPFFFSHYATRQQRVMINNKLVNPQLSKLQRFMIYRKSWETTVDRGNTDSMDNFWLRTAEGLGFKTEQMAKDVAITKVKALVQTPAMQAAIAVAGKAVAKDAKLTQEEKDALIEGVALGKTAGHSLDALVGLAEEAKGAATFTVNMLAEVDGVTNGPMLSHLALGAAEDVGKLFEMLYRGGFFKKGSEIEDFNQWRSAVGNQDLYESISAHMQANMATLINEKKIDSALAGFITEFLGDLSINDVVTSAGRKLLKTPVTAVGYSSSLDTAINEGMVGDFIAGIYKRIEKLAEDPDNHTELRKVVKAMQGLGLQIRNNVTVDELMVRQFSGKEVKQLTEVFANTYGKAVKKTLREDFAILMERRRLFTKVADITYGVYDAAYKGVREDYIAELMEAGKIDFREVSPKDANGKAIKNAPKLKEAIQGLNSDQEKELDARIASMVPVLQTAMSNYSGVAGADTGIMVAKSERTVDNSLPYKNQVKFGTPFADNGAESTNTFGSRVINARPGVSMDATSTQSIDSAIMHTSIEGREVLGLHDAQGVGIHQVQESGKALNEATWLTNLHYSPAQEMYNSYARVIHGLDTLLSSDKVPSQVVDYIVQELLEQSDKSPEFEKKEKNGKTAYVKGDPIPATEILLKHARQMKIMAFRADQVRLGAMSEMETIAQYAVQGGAYTVTDKQRTIAEHLLSKLDPAMNDKDLAAFQRVEKYLASHIKAAQEGMPTVAASVVTAQSLALKEIFNGKATAPISEVVAGLRAQLPTTGTSLIETSQNNFNQKLLSVIEKTILKDVTVRLVTSETNPNDLLEPLRENALGAYVSLPDGRHEINLRDNAISIEVMLHELTHAALARVVANPSKEAKPLIAELEKLRVNSLKITNGQYVEALKDVQEMIAWGMSNSGFQNEVLKQVKMGSANEKNSLITGMKVFINNLVKMIFGRPNENMNNGMSVLILNVSGLFAEAAKKNTVASTTINQSMAVNSLRDLSTIDIYNALEQNNNGATVSAEHSTHLTGLLNTIVKAIYGPFGSFKEALMEQTARDPLDVYTEAMQTGKAPFAVETLGAGFAFTEQEAFVLEQVEAAMRTALESKDGVMTIAYKELTKLYSEVRAKLTVESFHKGDWATATITQKEEAQRLYDFVFEFKQDASGKSDYMARFAALGLTHAGFREQLQFSTTTTTADPNVSFNERLNRVFNTIMGWIAGKLTETFKGQRADQKLNSLVQQIIGIQAKKINKLEHQNATLNAISATAGDMSTSVREAVEKFSNKPFFKNSGNAFVRLVGTTMSAVAGDRVDALMETYQKLRDKTMTGQLGVFPALINEVRGATEATQVYQYLLRATKHLEGQRKDMITHVSQVVTASFTNGGEDLKEKHNKALTAVVLRGDMQALASGPNAYTTAQLHDMVNDRTKVQTEIAAHEAQLTGPMRKFYQVSAEHLGFFLATSKISSAHQLFNAGNIARVMGTGMESRVSEDQAVAATPIIDRLASLYALKYAEKNDITALREVFAAEAARTDGGHGIEMIMKTHTALQAESKDKLFAGSEALQMKGYVPEVYDPYMSVVMATDDQGAELELRGYVAMPGYLGQDSADPFTEKKRIYSLRDGGMKQWNSGIFSTTDTRAKGNRVIHGASSISAAGQQNAANMAAITAGKRAGIQAMFNGTVPKPLQVKETHMAPVLNANGDVTNYRYMMSNHVKDNLLNRDNRTGKLLGSMAGNTFDKVTSKVQNRNAIQALHDQYRADYAENAASYLSVGPTSPDPQLREIWNMLPRDAQEQAKTLFGKDGLKVRNDVLDINFGYRKLSIGSVFDKEAAQRSFVEGMFVDIMTHAFQEKAQLRTRQVEDIWQAIVKETKANLVVKSWSTMTGNLRSNWSQLFLMGVSPVDIVKGHRVAFKAAWEYKQDNTKLFNLKNQLEIGHLEPGNTVAKVEYQIKRLEDSLARNPIRPLIDAGLMPTIVEDVSVDEDIYSYKSRFTEKIDSTVEAINPHILKGLQLLTMHHSTAPYKMMSYATQISDFLARYTLYQHDITKKNALTHEQAVQRASEAFINYDVPTHRKIQYANDSGLIMFSKYYIRIQKVLGRIYKESPGRVLALIAAEHMLGDQPTVLDSGFTHHFGNPFNGGALSYFSSLDSVTSVSLITGPFTTAVYNGQ